MPTSKARVGIEIYVDDRGTLRVREFADKTNKSLDDVAARSQSVTSRIKNGWTAVKSAWVGITASILAMREAWGLMNTAAQARQERVAFESLAQSYGTNSKKIIADLKKASNGTVDTMTMIRKAGTAMMMGIAPENVTRLMKISAATAKMTGQTVTKAFEDISMASARQSKMIMDNLGIIISLEDANKHYADKLGIVGRALTDAEQKQAFLNEAFEQGGDLMDRMGNQTDTQADKFQRLSATTADLKVKIGDGLIRAYQGLLGIMYTVESGIMTMVEGLAIWVLQAAKVTDWLHITSGAAQEWKINADAAKEAGVDFAGKASQAFKDMVSSNDAATAAQARHKKIIAETTKAIEDQGKAEKKLSDQQKKVVEDAKKKAREQSYATNEMYKEAGLGADAYFQQESTKLVEKAAKWQRAGADTLQVEEWLYDELGKLSEEAWGRGEESAGQYMDSVQAQSRTLVDEFNELQQSTGQVIDEISGKVMELDGTNIGLSVSFDGSAAYQGIDNLMAGLRGLQEATARASGVNSSPSRTTTPDLDNMMEGFSTFGTTKSSSVVNVNINQKVSRSDVNAIVSEQERRAKRS